MRGDRGARGFGQAERPWLSWDTREGCVSVYGNRRFPSTATDAHTAARRCSVEEVLCERMVICLFRALAGAILPCSTSTLASQALSRWIGSKAHRLDR